MERTEYQGVEIVQVDHNFNSYISESSLDEPDFERFKYVGAEKVYYWYGTGDYEGDGLALILSKGKWYAEGLAHCSCNGPTESLSLDPKDGVDSPEDLLPAYGCADSSNEIREAVKVARADLGKKKK